MKNKMGHAPFFTHILPARIKRNARDLFIVYAIKYTGIYATLGMIIVMCLFWIIGDLFGWLQLSDTLWAPILILSTFLLAVAVLLLEPDEENNT